MSKPDADRYCLDCPLVQIVADYQERKFWIHTEVITKSSDYFRRLLNDGRLHFGNPLVQPEWDAGHFNAYANWLYTNVFQPSLLGRGWEIDYEGLLPLYFLAEKLEDMRFQNVVLDLMADRYSKEREDTRARVRESLPNPKDVLYMYLHTAAGSRGRRLFVDMFAFGAAAFDAVSECEGWPAEFTMDLALRLLSLRPHPVRQPIERDWHQALRDRDETRRAKEKAEKEEREGLMVMDNGEDWEAVPGKQ